MKTKVASVFVGLLVVMATHLGARAETQQPRAKSVKKDRVYADSCGLKTAFLGNGGRNAATIFSLRYSSSR